MKPRMTQPLRRLPDPVGTVHLRCDSIRPFVSDLVGKRVWARIANRILDRVWHRLWVRGHIK